MADEQADARPLSEKVQDLLAEHYRELGAMATCFYLMVEGVSDDGSEWWAEAFTPGSPIRRRLALVEWSRAVVQSDAKDHVEALAYIADMDDDEED